MKKWIFLAYMGVFAVLMEGYINLLGQQDVEIHVSVLQDVEQKSSIPAQKDVEQKLSVSVQRGIFTQEKIYANKIYNYLSYRINNYREIQPVFEVEEIYQPYTMNSAFIV